MRRRRARRQRGRQAASVAESAPCIYLVGDVQGCGDALDRLLAEIDFSPSRDRLVRARRPGQPRPAIAGVLRRLRGLGDAGDLPARQPRPAPAGRRRTACGRGTAATRSTTSSTRPTATPGSTGCAQRRMAVHAHGWLMLHAGVVPQWDLAHDAGARRRGRAARCASAPPRELPAARCTATSRRAGATSLRRRRALRFIINVLTRIRFCTADGTLEFDDQGRRRRRAARATARGSTCPAGAPRACRSPSATGRRSAWSTAPTCSASTPAASGAAGSPRCASTAAAAR